MCSVTEYISTTNSLLRMSQVVPTDYAECIVLCVCVVVLFQSFSLQPKSLLPDHRSPNPLSAFLGWLDCVCVIQEVTLFHGTTVARRDRARVDPVTNSSKINSAA